jgi:hypothetical protein
MARYTVDLSDIQRGLSIGETRDLSRIGGLTLAEMQAVERGDMGDLPMSAMIAIVYVLLRRQHPRITEADINALSWDDIDFITPAAAENGHDGDVDPTVPLRPLSRGARA